jgi:hypothetical protein
MKDNSHASSESLPKSPSELKDDALIYVDEGLVSYASSQSGPRSLYVDGIKINVDPSVPPLAEGDEEKKWGWLDLFKRRKDIADPNAIATRPSVYDDVNLAPHYAPR